MYNNFRGIRLETISSNEFIAEFKTSYFLKVYGYIKNDEIDSFLDLVENEISQCCFDNNSYCNLLRILDSISDLGNFIKDCLRNKYYLRFLLSISYNSNFLTNILVVNPEYIYFILNPENLEYGINWKKQKAYIEKELSFFNKYDSKIKFLINQKRLFTSLIAIKDYNKISDLTETTSDLTQLANILLDNLFKICLKEVAGSISIKKLTYTMISLGKAGGRELNYSSDVDLILIFDKNKIIDKDKHLYSYDIFHEAIQLFVKTSSEVTYRGFLYRVDFRLRPDGKNSPLCRTINDIIHYYETRGTEFEKQMLLKMNFISGNTSLYNKFQKNIFSFIFHNPEPKKIFTYIYNNKKSIEKNNSDAKNIKLISGGIRDIEFIIQALQLVNGLNIREIICSSSLEALEKLLKFNLLEQSEFSHLREAYIFYRKIEHYAQLQNDQQIHSIPCDDQELIKLIRYLDLETKEKFYKKLKLHLARVKKIFSKHLKPADNKLKSVFADIRFTNKTRSIENYRFLSSGESVSGLGSYDGKTREIFREIEPFLLSYLRNCADADKTLENITRLINFLPFKSILFREFQNPKFFEAVLIICEYSDYSYDLLISDKNYCDFLFSGQVFEQNSNTLNFGYNIFKASVLATLNIIDYNEIKKILTESLSFNFNQLINYFKLYDKIAIIGLGSFGSDMFSFTSDLDLVIISEDVIDTEITIELISSIQKIVKPVQVDLRLRPEGKKGNLIETADQFSIYLNSRIRNWELSAYLKSHLIAGNELIYNNFLKKITNLFVERFSTNLKAEFTTLYKMIMEPDQIKIQSANTETKTQLKRMELIINYLYLSDTKINYKIFSVSLFDKLKKLIKSNVLPPTVADYYHQLVELNLRMSLINRNSNKNLIDKFLKPASRIPIDKIVNMNDKLIGRIFGIKKPAGKN